MAVYDLPNEWWHAYRSRLEAVGPGDVLEAARELIRPEEAVILVTGDAARIRDALAAADLGPLEEPT